MTIVPDLLYLFVALSNVTECFGQIPIRSSRREVVNNDSNS